MFNIVFYTQNKQSYDTYNASYISYQTFNIEWEREKNGLEIKICFKYRSLCMIFLFYYSVDSFDTKMYVFLMHTNDDCKYRRERNRRLPCSTNTAVRNIAWNKEFLCKFLVCVKIKLYESGSGWRKVVSLNKICKSLVWWKRRTSVKNRKIYSN